MINSAEHGLFGHINIEDSQRSEKSQTIIATEKRIEVMHEVMMVYQF
jgi:hypothetical protein